MMRKFETSIKKFRNILSEYQRLGREVIGDTAIIVQ